MPGQSIHWASSIEFDPFIPNRVLVTSGNGVFVNDDINAPAGVWKFFVRGLEETVALKKTPAERWLDRYNGEWQGDLTKIFDEAEI